MNEYEVSVAYGQWRSKKVYIISAFTEAEAEEKALKMSKKARMLRPFVLMVRVVSIC